MRFRLRRLFALQGQNLMNSLTGEAGNSAYVSESRAFLPRLRDRLVPFHAGRQQRAHSLH
jgi:hypothetical protein